MNKEQIEKIIENLTKEGYHLANKTIEDDLIKLDSVMPIDYRVTFDQDNVNFLNSITSYWSIYKHWLEFKFTPKNKLELEATLKELLESYN